MGRGSGTITPNQQMRLSLRGLGDYVDNIDIPEDILEIKTADELEAFLKLHPDPYAGIQEKDFAKVSEIMFEAAPIDKNRLIKSIQTSYKKILKSEIGGKPLTQMRQANTIVTNIMHESVVDQIAKQKGFLAGTNHKTEPDVVYRDNPFFSLEVKTNQSKTGVQGNKSYAIDNAEDGESGKSRSCFYIIVNYTPPAVRTKSGVPEINRIGFAYFTPSDWNIYTKKGKETSGQIVPLHDASKAKIFNLYEG